MIVVLSAIAAISSGVVAQGSSVSGSAAVVTVIPSEPRSSHCPDARAGLAYYRPVIRRLHRARGARLAHAFAVSPRDRCGLVRKAARLSRLHAVRDRHELERYLEARTLRDVESWVAAVELVQRVFPGTSSWLLSCSDAEGMSPSLDRTFYTFGFRPFSWAAWSSNTVGGPMQLRPRTFVGFYARGLGYLRARGFRVPAELAEPSPSTWQSMTAQAIAGGWARFTGNDDSHWSASWGRGC